MSNQYFSGFAFFELLTIVAMIGILAAVAVPTYSDYVTRSQVTEGLLLTVNVKKAISDYYAYHGKMPADNHSAGVSPPDKLIGNYVARLEVTQGNILVTFGNRSGPNIHGHTLSLRPQISPSPSPFGILFWECSQEEKTALERKYLPSICKKQ